VVQQLTVDTTIADAEILQGLQQGCDCIYSSVTYVYCYVDTVVPSVDLSR
jgi:hypothetical protein